MLTAEHSYTLELEASREDGRIEGIREGISQGIREGMREGISQGIREGMREGISQGIREGSINTAKRMKKASCEPSFIMEMTGLSKQEIEKL